MSGKIRVRRGTFAELPALGQGELGYAMDTKELAVGGLNGNDLLTNPSGIGGPGATGPQGATGVSGAGISFANIYQVPSPDYSTIQAAIDQAHDVDGHTSSLNPAIIEIAPGSYTENLTIKSGVFLKGMVSGAVTNIIGDVTYSPTISQSQQLNRVNFYDLSITGKLELSGSIAGRLVLRSTGIEQLAGTTNPAVLLNNAQGRIDFRAASGAFHSDPNGITVDVQLGRLTAQDAGINGFTQDSAGQTAPVLRIGNVSNRVTFHNFSVSGQVLINSPNADIVAIRSSFDVFATGVTNIHFAADGIANFVNCRFLNTDSGGAVLATTDNEGTIGFTSCDINGNTDIAPQLNLFSEADRIRIVKNGWEDEVLVDLYSNKGFSSITEALQYIINSGESSASIKLAIGNYNEDIIWPDNINLYVFGETKEKAISEPFGGGIHRVHIHGNHVLNSTTGNARLKFTNISFNSREDGNHLWELQGTTFGQVDFENCYFRKGDDPSDGAIAFLSNTSSSGYSFFNCSFNRSDSTIGRGIVIEDNTNGFAWIKNCIFIQDGGAGSVPSDVPMIDIGSQINYSSILVENSYFRGESSKLFSIGENANITFNLGCSIEINCGSGQVVYFKGNGSVHLYSGTHMDGNYFPGGCLARDGHYASASISLTSNTWGVGSGLNINGVPFIANSEFVVGGTTNQTAQNIAEAINTSNDPAVYRKVFAVVTLANIELRSWVWNAAANSSNTLSGINSPPAIISGSFSGGANGNGGRFVYGSATFGNPIIQTTISIEQLREHPNNFDNISLEPPSGNSLVNGGQNGTVVVGSSDGNTSLLSGAGTMIDISSAGKLTFGTIGNSQMHTFYGHVRTIVPVPALQPSGNQTLDFALSTSYRKTGGNATITLANLGESQTAQLVMEATGSAYTLAWNTVRWTNAAIPTPSSTAGRHDVYTFIKINGIIYGTAILNMG